MRTRPVLADCIGHLQSLVVFEKQSDFDLRSHVATIQIPGKRNRQHVKARPPSRYRDGSARPPIRSYG